MAGAAQEIAPLARWRRSFGIRQSPPGSGSSPLSVLTPSVGGGMSPVDVRDPANRRAGTASQRFNGGPDRDCERIVDGSSPTDHRACGPASATRCPTPAAITLTAGRLSPTA